MNTSGTSVFGLVCPGCVVPIAVGHYAAAGAVGGAVVGRPAGG